MKPYLAQIRANLRLMKRDRAVLFFSLFFPLLFFVIFATSFGGARNPGAMSQVIDMVLVLGILGSGFFGAGMRAVQDRESNVLRRFKVAPVGPAPIIVAALVSGLVSYLPIVFLVVLLAHSWMRMPLPPRPLDFLVFVALGSLAFRAMGMIVAAVVNSPQESQIITQIIYLPMLFLSGATFPVQFFPHWMQIISQFIPATYLLQGMQSIFIAGTSLAGAWMPVLALIITLCLALFWGVKLFRWEKEEKIARRAKLWIVVVMLPFFAMGLYQSRHQENIRLSKVIDQRLRRLEARLFQNVRIFVGNGTVIQKGAVLVRDGRIAQVFDSPPGNAGELKAEVIDAPGKTLLPGLIDMHVHLSAPGGASQNPSDYLQADAPRRELAAYLYCGITAVRSAGDPLNQSLELRKSIEAGEVLAAELFVTGPMFTAPGGHGTEYARFLPAQMRAKFEQETVRTPRSAAEAEAQVHQLKAMGVDGIKAILEAGFGGQVFPRLDTAIYRAVVAAARSNGLPVATHTGDLRDIEDAIDAGTATIEHGSMRVKIPAELLARAAQAHIGYDPTLSVAEALFDRGRGRELLLDRSLLQQVAPPGLLEGTRQALREANGERRETDGLEVAKENLRRAYQAGLELIAGSDAGNFLVMHGPTVQRELALWVSAGIPPGIALRAATGGAAERLGAGKRFGTVEEGREATLILVEGNPLEDIAALERITYVLFHGEQVARSELARR